MFAESHYRILKRDFFSMFGRPNLLACLLITSRWLIPSFNFKYKQTQLKIRTPLWFKDMIKEWDNISKRIPAKNHDHILTSYQNWSCSCDQFILSGYYLCSHLIQSSDISPKYYDGIMIQDKWPFVKFLDKMEIPDLKDHQFQVNESQEEPIVFSDNNEFLMLSNSDNKSTKNETTYQMLIDLVQFLKDNVEKNRYNQKQLQVISDCMKEGYKYKNSIQKYEYEKRNTIPRSWSSDLDKYLFFQINGLVQLKVPNMDIRLNQPYSLDILVSIGFVDNPGLKDFIKHAINDDEKPNLVI
jgi:hypothetical protein